MTEAPTDEEIVVRVQRGDKESFGVLMDRYEPRLARYTRKFMNSSDDAADVLQETFIKAYMNIQGFDTSRRFSPWIYRIAHNVCINAIKKKGRDPLWFFDTDTLFPHPIAKETADGPAQRADIKQMLEKCLDKIGPKYREVLVLYYYEELNYQEIAEVLHVPVATVGVRLSRGKQLLKKYLQNHI